MAEYRQNKKVDPSYLSGSDGGGRIRVQRGTGNTLFQPTDEWEQEQDTEYQTTAIGKGFQVDPALLRDIYKVYNAKGIHFESDEEAVKQWYEDMVWALGNTMSTAFGKQGYYSATGIEDESVRQANNRLRNAYYQMPSFYEEGGMGWWEGMKQWLGATASDPLNLVGASWGLRAARAGYAGAKALGKPAGSLVRKRARQGAVSEGAIAGGIVGAQDLGVQAADIELDIQDDIRWGQAGAATLMGAGGGALFGGIFAAIGGKMAANKIQRNIETLTRNDWTPQQIHAMLGKNAAGDPVDTKWFDAYAKNEVTPTIHRAMPKDRRADLGAEEPPPFNPKGTPLLTGPPQKYEDVHSELNRRIKDAQQNIEELIREGADWSGFLEQRNQFQLIKKIVGRHEAKKAGDEYATIEEVESAEQSILDVFKDPSDEAIERLDTDIQRRVERAADADFVADSEGGTRVVKADETAGAVYHLTPTENLPSILRDGLIPQTGRPAKVRDERNAVHLFNSLEDAEDALTGWLGEEVGEVLDARFPEDFRHKPLSLLQIDGHPPLEGAWQSAPHRIDPSNIRVLSTDAGNEGSFSGLQKPTGEKVGGTVGEDGTPVVKVDEPEAKTREDAGSEETDIMFSTAHPEDGAPIHILETGEEIPAPYRWRGEDPAPDKAIDTLDRSPHITDEIHNFGKNVEDYTKKRKGGPKKALHHLARVLNEKHGENIDTYPKGTFASAEELSPLVHDAATRANQKQGVEEVEGLTNQIVVEIEAQLQKSDPRFVFNVHAPRMRADVILDLIDDMAGEFLDQEIKGDWEAAGEALKARVLKARAQKPVRVDQMVQGDDNGVIPLFGSRIDIPSPESNKKAINSLPKNVRKGLLKTIEERLKTVVKLRSMFRSIENKETLEKLIAGTEKYVITLYGLREDVTKISYLDMVDMNPGEIALHINMATKLRAFKERARTAKGEGLFNDPIFETIRNRVIEDVIEAARIKSATKGAPSSSSGRIASGIGLTPGKQGGQSRTHVRADWGGSKTKGRQVAQAIAEMSGTDAPVPFVAAVREEITSESVRHLRKDGTPYFKPKIAKKGSKLWYDPISKKTWTHENHHAMRVARGEAEVEGGKGTSSSATDIMYSTAHPDDGSAGRLDSGDAATRRTEDTPEGHEGKISDMSDAELDVLAAKVKSALKIKKAEKEAAAKTSGKGVEESSSPEQVAARMRARRKSIAKVMAESDPEARIPAILRKAAPAQARNDPSSFLSLYFRVTGKKQNDPDLATLVGAKGMKREGESKRWVMGTVPARYKGKASIEALEHFIPDNQKERHFMDRYKVSGFVLKNEDGTPFTPVNFRDVQDDEIDISHLSPGFQDEIKKAYGTRMTVTDLENLIRNKEASWPIDTDDIVPRLEEMTATSKQIHYLKTLYTLRNENYPGGIVHGEATRLQSFAQIRDVFESEPRLSDSIVDVMDHLTRKTGDTAPSFATMRAGPDSDGLIQLGAHQATDLRRAMGYNPEEPADISINETVVRQRRPDSNINTPFGAVAHEMMHWAYHNVLNDNERLYFWENVVLPKGKNSMMEDGRVSNNVTNIGDGPGEYFAEQAALYIEKKMPGALDQKWWEQILGETVEVLKKILYYLDYKTEKSRYLSSDERSEYGGLDEHVVEILERILPDEFRAKLHENAARKVQKDVKKYKWVYIGGKHGQRIIGRANAFDSVRHELQEALDLDSGDIDAVPSAAINMAAHLLDSSHERILGGKLSKSMVALATAVYDITHSTGKTPKTHWGSTGAERTVSLDEHGDSIFADQGRDTWLQETWNDQGVIRFDDDGTEHFQGLIEEGIIDADGYVLDDSYEALSSEIRRLFGDRIFVDKDGTIRDVSGEEVRVDADGVRVENPDGNDAPMEPDDADDFLANQAAKDSTGMTEEQITRIKKLFELDDTQNVLREYEKIIAQRYQTVGGVASNKGWEDQLLPHLRQHYIKNEIGLPREWSDASANLQAARRKSSKKAAERRRQKRELGVAGALDPEIQKMSYPQLGRIVLGKDPEKSKDAAKEVWLRVVKGTPPAEGTIAPAYKDMNYLQLTTMLAKYQKLKKMTPAEREEVRQIKSELIRRANNKRDKLNKPPPPRTDKSVHGEVRDIGNRPVVDGIPHNTRSHLREILFRITERTPEKQIATRTVAYRIMNLTGLSDPRQPITNNHIATLAGRAVESTPDKPLNDFSDEGFKSFRSQVRSAVKNNDVVKMAQFAIRAGVLNAEELAAVKLSFKDEGQFLDRWVAHAKEGRAPLRGVRDEVLPDVDSAMDNITSSVAYIMDGIDAFDNWYITHPRLAEFADPLFVHKPKQSRDFARRLRGKKSVSQDMAGSYAKDVIDAMPVRTKRNLHAFIGTGIARTANGVIPYFVRSNGDTAAVLPVDGDFGPGVYASTRSKPYAKSLNEIVAEHLNEVDAPAEKIATADSLATRLSDVRSDISDARALAEWHDLSDTGLDELFEIEAGLASDLHKVTGRHYDQVSPVVSNSKKYADLSHASDNKSQDWLIREFMNRVVEEGDTIAVSAKIMGAQNRPGVEDRGRALYDAMWRSLASDKIPEWATNGVVSAKARVNEILKDMGYDGIKFTGSHRLRGGAKDQHTEYVIFNKDNVRRLDDPRFDEDDVLTFNTAPEDATIVTPIVRDIIEGGDGSNVGVAHTIERGGSEPTDRFVDDLRVRVRGKPKPESIVEAHRKGPTFYLRKGSSRLRMIGDRYFSNFFQKDKGTGIFERVDSEIGRKLMPIVRALNALPGSSNAFQRWFKRSIDVRHRSRPTEAEYNVMWALRTGEETHLKTDGERLAYRRIRETFESEKEQLIHYGIMHSGIARNYVSQIWSPTRISRNIVRAREKLADYFQQEALLRDEVLSREKAQGIAKRMISKILDDDGVHFPPQYASKNEPGLDNVDYQRMIMLQKPEFRGNLKELEEFLEGDLSSILAKYLDGSSRKIEFAKRFGQGNRGAMMYMRILREGNEAAINALTRPREIRRTRRGIVDGEVETVQTKDEIPAPFGKNRVAAEQLVANLVDVLNNPARGGVVEAERILKNPGLHKFPLSERKKFQWDRQAEAIVAGLEMNLRGELPPAETKLMENLLMASQRKQWGTDSYAYTTQKKISRFLRNFNALTKLSFTTITSLTDPFILLIRSGEMGSWLRGIRRYASDPDYRAMIKDSGLSIENYVHNRLVGMYGVDASKLTTAFFNASMLTPWTDTMRELAGIIGIEWFKTEQKRIARHGLNSRAGRRAKRVLESYGLDDYARPDSPSIEDLIKSRRHLGEEYDEAIDPRLVIENEKLRDALIKFANDTIFAPNTNDTPLWAQTPAGAMMWQLKSFPMMMARLGKDNIMEIWKDPKNWHSYKPMIMLAAMGPAGGAMALTAKDIIQMRGSEEEGIVRDRNVTSMREWLKAVGYDPEIHGTDPNDFAGWYFEGMLHLGGFGLYAELLHNAVEQADNGYYGYTRTMGNILGPSFGETVGVWNVAQGLGNVLFGEDDGPNGQARQAAREVIQRIPVVGGIKAAKESLTDLWAGEKKTGGGSNTRYRRKYSR